MIYLEPEHLFEFYRNTFLPAYSDYVGFAVKKPMQVLNELENTLAHLSQYYNPELSDEQKQENITKSCDHLERVTLDLYKLLWVELHRQLELVYLDENKRSFALNTSEEDFIKGFNAFRNRAQEARDVEIKKVGANPLLAIELYKESIGLGKELINNIDHSKLTRLKKFKLVYTIKQNIIGFVLGLFSGLLANYFWTTYLQYFGLV